MSYVEAVARLLEPALWQSYDMTPPQMHLRLTQDALEMSKQRAMALIEKMSVASPEMIAAGADCGGDTAHVFHVMMQTAMRGG